MAPKLGLVALASKLELGGERSDDLLAAVTESLTAAEVELVVGKKIVENAADALEVCDQLKNSGITSLVILDVTWQGDSIKYLFTQQLGLPTVYWAVPYADTFSMACVQHYISVLTLQGIPAKYVYGMPADKAAIDKVVLVAKAGHVIDRLKKTRVALLGPRNAWRVAGAAEMVNEEWELSKQFGLTIVHVEMEEVTDVARGISDAAAARVLQELAPRTGRVTASEETMLWMAKVYLGVKALVRKYGLDVVVAECYPRYAGLMNAVASWLGDEGLVVETEGDIGNSVAMHILNTAAAGDDVAPTCVLAETGGFDDENDYVSFSHEGSSATVYAQDVSQVTIQQMDDGTQVCFIVKPMESATACSLVGAAGEYKMLVARTSTLEASQEEWDAAGTRLFAKLRFNEKPGKVIDTMIREGVGHHWVLKEGDYADIVQIVCDYLKVATLGV